MSIFRRFSKKVPVVRHTPMPLLDEGQSNENIYSAFYLGMPAEVYSDNGDFILSGKVFDYSETQVSLSRNVGTLSFPICGEDNHVKLRVYKRDMQPLNASAVVSSGGRIRWVLTQLEELSYEQKREGYRLPTNIDGTILFSNGVRSRSNSCTVCNIGIGGALIRTKEEMEVDFKLKLKFSLSSEGKELIRECQVLRRQPIAEYFEYGLLFAQMSLSDQENLMQEMNRYQAQHR